MKNSYWSIERLFKIQENGDDVINCANKMVKY